MARYIGPKLRVTRRFGEPTFGADKVLARRDFSPGQHGNNRRRRIFECGAQFTEKQKARYTYGVLERQFRNLFDKAAKTEGITGEVFLQSLESCLDNVVFRLSIAPTHTAARQLVSHKRIIVNGSVANIISYQVKADDVIDVHEKAKPLEVIGAALAGLNHSEYPWLEWDDSTKCGRLFHRSDRIDVPENTEEQLIVELYSKQ